MRQNQRQRRRSTSVIGLAVITSTSLALLGVSAARSANSEGAPSAAVGSTQLHCATTSSGAMTNSSGTIVIAGQVGAGQMVGDNQRIALGGVYCLAGGAVAIDGCPFTCGQLAGGPEVDLVDFGAFQVCFGQPTTESVACACADLNGSGTIDLGDFAILVNLVGKESSNTPPNCP
jgi:hypothetical protein